MIRMSLSEEATLIIESTQFSDYTVRSHIYHGMQHTKKEKISNCTVCSHVEAERLYGAWDVCV
jgi:hypothetical protein